VSSDLIVERRDAVLRLTVNRPARRNALSLAVLDAIGEAFTAHAADPALRCAVVTGSGDRCFAAGGDLQELDAIRSPEDTLAMSRRGRRALQALRDFPLPVVALLNGHALGGGAELALACDLRVAVPHAEIGFLQAQLEVTTAWGGGIDLALTLGDRRAQQLLASGRRVPAPEALALGLVDRVVPAGTEPEAFLAEVLQDYVPHQRHVVAGIKALTTTARRRAHAELAATEEQHFVMSWIHPAHWEAVARATAPKR
jgi:enoyl-CoA hydratase